VVNTARADAGSSLRSEDDPVGMLLHDLLVTHRLVVEAGYVHVVDEMISDSVIPFVERGDSRTSRIFFVKKICQPFRFFPSICRFLLRNFIPDAPHNDAGVVAVTPDHVAQIALRPLVEVLAVPVRHFRDAPHVEGFIHDHQTHAVAIFKQFGRWRIVAGANRVDAARLHNLQLPFDGAAVYCGAQCAQVMMQAYPMQLVYLAIQKKAFLFVE
jgi:hypothetical protein